MRKNRLSSLLAPILLSVCILTFVRADASSWQIPPAPHVKTVDVVDDYFGTKVPDRYRWLEDESLPDTQAFVTAQNQRTRAFLDSPQREQLKQRITELYDYPRQSAPFRKGEVAFFSTNSGLQNQSVLHVTDKIGDAGRVLIDPNQLSPDGTVSLGDTVCTEDGTLMAYSLHRSGSDHSDIRVKRISTGEDLPDIIPPARQGDIAWLHDDSGFYYSRFPKTTELGAAEQAYNDQLLFHKLAAPATEDRIVYQRPDDRELAFTLNITEDGKYELMSLSRGTKPQNRLYWRPTNSQQWNKLIDDENFQYNPIEDDAPLLYLLTTDDAPRGRVIAVDFTKPDRKNWKQLIPQGDDVISNVQLIGEKFIVTVLRDAHHVLRIYNKDGSFDRDVELPTIGSVNVAAGRRRDSDFFYAFTSYSYPTTILRYDLKTGVSTTIFAPQVKFNPADYQTTQTFATSKDGTKVPVFITCKKGIAMDGSHPCLLYGYGGFDISLTPGFSSSRIAWLERGGIYAVACLRGGGEYGEDWHKAGMLDKKQNVFDDFAASAEFLIDQKYTTSNRLAIMGGSNGGLLVAACMLEHPELYGAVVCQVPLTDMLRYQKLGIGRFWTVEYGNAEASIDQFKTLYAYSPLHNVKPGGKYPPILIITAEGDNRVVPGHSYKFTATLQANSAPDNLVLLRIESKAGHGGGKPISKIIDETADTYAFLTKIFHMN